MNKTYKTIWINSSKRSTGSDTDFTVQLSADLLTKQPSTFKVVSVKVPYTWYPIVSTNCSFNVNVSEGFTLNITIPSQGYVPGSLASQLQTLINAAATSAGAAANFTVSYDSNRKKFNVARAANYFQMVFNVPNSAYQILGFLAQTYGSITTTTTITSDQVINMVPDTYVFVHCDLITGADSGVVVIDPSTTPASNSILCAIPIQTGFGSILSYENTIAEEFNIEASAFVQAYLTATRTGQPLNRSIRFWLSLPSGNTISLNGLSWQAQLAFGYKN